MSCCAAALRSQGRRCAGVWDKRSENGVRMLSERVLPYRQEGAEFATWNGSVANTTGQFRDKGWRISGGDRLGQSSLIKVNQTKSNLKRGREGRKMGNGTGGQGMRPDCPNRADKAPHQRRRLEVLRLPRADPLRSERRVSQYQPPRPCCPIPLTSPSSSRRSNTPCTRRPCPCRGSSRRTSWPTRSTRCIPCSPCGLSDWSRPSRRSHPARGSPG